MADFTPSNGTAPVVALELDFIFPRDETYAASTGNGFIPLAVNVLDPYHVQPNYSALSWSIQLSTSTGPGDFETPLVLDDGLFTVMPSSDPGLNGSTILVSYTNVAAWPHADGQPFHLDDDNIQLVIMTADDSSHTGPRGVLPGGCGPGDTGFLQGGYGFGQIPFRVETDVQVVSKNASIKTPSVGEAPGCPAMGAADLVSVSTETDDDGNTVLCFGGGDGSSIDIGVPTFDTVSCTDRATIPVAVRTSIDHFASSMAAAGPAAVPSTTSGATGSTPTQSSTGSSSDASSSSTSTSTNAADKHQLSIGRVFAVAGILSWAVQAAY
ncbi:hypothetical protein SBRCBS47491_007516 [Sporothrix bragantina]|uniref:Uncharacterized protein n=1 Tax=Sporothrix bragantina TaxID=671064 RepID=A0ABP0CDS9_9PEZI